MNRYIKPKNGFPEEISLHDARIKSCRVENDTLILEFERYQVFTHSSDHELWADGGKVAFYDFDDYEGLKTFRIMGKNKVKEYTFKEFKKLLKHGEITQMEIIDEYYRWISAMYCGVLRYKGKWRKFQLELHYLGDMIYEYE